MSTDHAQIEPTSSRVLTAADHAVLGVQMAEAGLNGTEARMVLAMVEQAAQDAARQVALAVAPALLKLVHDTHASTAKEIERRISTLPSLLGGLGSHRACAAIARDVGTQAPRHS